MLVSHITAYDHDIFHLASLVMFEASLISCTCVCFENCKMFKEVLQGKEHTCDSVLPWATFDTLHLGLYPSSIQVLVTRF